MSFPHADEVNLLDKMTSHAQDLTNTSFGYDEANCSVLGIGQYSTLSIPTREAFGDRWASGRATGWGQLGITPCMLVGLRAGCRIPFHKMKIIASPL